MEFAVAADVLYIGSRERAARLAQSLEDCRVRWVDSRRAALALLDGREQEFACVVTDGEDVGGAVEEQVGDVRCLSVDEDGSLADAERVAELATAVSSAVEDAPSYPLPVNEGARLDDLRPYLREEVVGAACFDRLASLAARLLEGRMAFVGLVDRHTEHVMAATEEFPETLPRVDSVCTHTILDNGPLVVEDVAHDDRFADNELLDELGIRAYAGVPVRGRLGETIGTICVLDSIPRGFTSDEIDLLTDLAAEATDQFELRRRVADETGTVA